MSMRKGIVIACEACKKAQTRAGSHPPKSPNPIILYPHGDTIQASTIPPPTITSPPNTRLIKAQRRVSARSPVTCSSISTPSKTSTSTSRQHSTSVANVAIAVRPLAFPPKSKQVIQKHASQGNSRSSFYCSSRLT